MAKSSSKAPQQKVSPRAQTGVPGLDDLIEGGLKRGSVVTLSGDAGSGKTTLAMQFLYNGVKKFNEPAVFVSLEQSKAALMDDLARFGWDLADLEKKHKLRIISLLPHEAADFQNSELPVQSAIEEIGAKRLVIDSVTSIILSYKTKPKARQGLIKLIEKLRNWGVTTILTSESTTDIQGDVHSAFKIDFLTDGVIYLYNMRRNNYRLHAVEVVKMRGTSVNGKMCPLKFGKAGIEIYPNQNVFK
ncbi:MAG: ATPase domain-containing protein [Candidatus Micrarchaeia archaeon]|jgi:circadian clock protein KaiC